MTIPTPISFDDEKTTEKTYNLDHGKLIDLTPEAVLHVKNFAMQNEKAKGKFFKVYVEGGGCSGLQYGFTFADKDDTVEVVPCEGIEVLVDKASTTYLKGSIVDYVNELGGAGFIVKNPQSTAECGCGVSFTV